MTAFRAPPTRAPSKVGRIIPNPPPQDSRPPSPSGHTATCRATRPLGARAAGPHFLLPSAPVPPRHVAPPFRPAAFRSPATFARFTAAAHP
jgi:hypothetical protein